MEQTPEQSDQILGWGWSAAVELLPSVHKALGSILRTAVSKPQQDPQIKPKLYRRSAQQNWFFEKHKPDQP